MESWDSSPNYMRATSSSDAKKEISPPQGGSECDDRVSISSSTCGSSVNSTGIKYRTINRKAVKSVRSFRRRAKSRIIEMPDDSSSSHHESKASFPSHRTLPTLSRTSSNRNVRILIKKASFKPKRSSLSHPQLSENVSVNRPTYSSALKDSKFPEPVELHPESEGLSGRKICRYHHCSLHGHCHGPHDPVPPVKRFLYKRRLSMKKQKSMIPRNEPMPGIKRSRDKEKSVPQSRMSSVPNLSFEERKDENIAFSSVKSKKGNGSYPDISSELNAQNLGNEYWDIGSDLVEIAFGETSFPEKSYEENLEILRNYSPNYKYGYCLKCSCSMREEQITPTPKNADVDYHEVLETVDTNVSDTNSTAHFDTEEREAFGGGNCENEGSHKDFPATPVISDEVTKKHGPFSSTSESQISSGSNSDLEGEFAVESGNSNETCNVTRVEDEAAKFPAVQAKLQFSKPRHISMWHLIHQHMSSGLGTEAANMPKQNSGDENPVESADSQPMKESSTVSESEKVGAEENDTEIQEIELRKLFAIKLVREAIEKILLPEVQDQTSDDQSVTSESTPRRDLSESNGNKALVQESNDEDDADKKQGNTSPNLKEESQITNEASSPETAKTEEKIVIKSEKKAPKHWSNLKKWILLQRFIRELEKVKKFNPKKPNHLPLTPDPEAEKVNLRPQTLDERKRSEEWMLDYALRQAVSQLAPTQKRKVALLVKAFETVIPPQEEPQIQFRIPTLMDMVNEKAKLDGNDKVSTSNAGIQGSVVKLIKKTENAFSLDHVNAAVVQRSSDENPRELSSFREPKEIQRGYGTTVILDGSRKSVITESSPDSASDSNLKLEKMTSKEKDAKLGLKGLLEDRSSSDYKEAKDRQKHVKMWHMIYQHVVSGIAEKVGSELLNGADDEEAEADQNISKSAFSSPENHDFSFQKNGFTKSDALKLVKEAVEEIMLPDTQDDNFSDTQLITSEIDPDQDISDQNQEEVKSQPQNLKNWSKLKKLLVLKRSIIALEKARKRKPQAESLFPQTNKAEADKIDLRSQMMDERNMAEQWMLDYAVQHIVTKLTPARKRRVSMLVEAFEAVVPFPES